MNFPRLLALWLCLSGLGLATPLWTQPQKASWTHPAGVSLKIAGRPKVDQNDDGALRIETEEYLVQILAFSEKDKARAASDQLIGTTEAAFPDLEFSAAELFAQPDGRVAAMQQGMSEGIGFLLANVSQKNRYALFFAVLKTRESKDAVLALMSALRFAEPRDIRPAP